MPSPTKAPQWPELCYWLVVNSHVYLYCVQYIQLSCVGCSLNKKWFLNNFITAALTFLCFGTRRAALSKNEKSRNMVNTLEPRYTGSNPVLATHHWHAEGRNKPTEEKPGTVTCANLAVLIRFCPDAVGCLSVVDRFRQKLLENLIRKSLKMSQKSKSRPNSSDSASVCVEQYEILVTYVPELMLH